MNTKFKLKFLMFSSLSFIIISLVFDFATYTNASIEYKTNIKNNSNMTTDTKSQVPDKNLLSESNGSKISNLSDLSQGSNVCPEGYFNDEGVCRIIPSQQPDPPASAPICPPGYFAQSGGICEKIPRQLER